MLCRFENININELVEREIIIGYPSDSSMIEFRPDNEITRAEMVKLLVATKKLESIENYEGSEFSDWSSVPVWAKPYVAASTKAGILLGSLEAYGVFVFAFNSITREEMIAMAVRALEIEIPEGGTSDAPDFDEVSDWARDYVAFAIENGMTNTGTDGSVDGRRYAKRDETAMVLYMLIKHLEG